MWQTARAFLSLFHACALMYGQRDDLDILPPNKRDRPTDLPHIKERNNEKETAKESLFSPAVCLTIISRVRVPRFPLFKLIYSSRNRTAGAVRSTGSYRTVCHAPSADSMSGHDPLRVSATHTYCPLLSEPHRQPYLSFC